MPDGISDLDFERVAEWVQDEAQQRKGRRTDHEIRWKEVDRQVKMDPIPKHADGGRPIDGTEWMPQMELPLQAQALELLNADARRLMFPDDRNFFSVRAQMDGEKLESMISKPMIEGLDNTVEALLAFAGLKEIDQETLDEIHAAALRHYHRQYDYRGVWDLLNAEAFKYGTFVGRGMRVDPSKFTNDLDGVRRIGKGKIPVIVPRTIWHTYLDDSADAIMHEGLMIEPGVIEWRWRKLEDIRKAAGFGKNNPADESGGWMKKKLAGIEPFEKSRNLVQVIDFEGDVVIPRNSGPSIFLPNAMLTVLVSRAGPVVIRYREREFAFRSYFFGHYHRHDVQSAYATSPLMIGSPLHKAATELHGRLLQAAALNTEPPIRWDPSDWYLEAMGGPQVFPRAMWKANTTPEPIKIGDIGMALQAYLSILQQYADATGISAPRLGAQTKSHQTASAVATEVGRGMVRTVDYVRATMFGPMSVSLNMEMEMARKSLKDEVVYLDKYETFLRLDGADLSPLTIFDVHGAAGPSEERESRQNKLQALQTVIGIEIQKFQLAQATGAPYRPLDLDSIQKTVLREGGWGDVDTLITGAGANVASPPGAGADDSGQGAAAGAGGDNVTQLQTGAV